MTPDTPVVCVGFPRWEGSDYLSSTVQLMRELARRRPVLYVDYPYTYKDLWAALRGADTGVPLSTLLGRAPRLQTRTLPDGTAVHLLRLPPFLPANFLATPRWYDAVNARNAQRAARAIRRATAQLGWQRPVVINAFNPALGNELAGRLDESLLVYYCYDEISAAPWIARHGSRHEAAFLPRVDLTVVTSQGLYERKQPHTPVCRTIKNGVDLDVFQRQSERPADVPSGAVIGYIGSVDDRLDYALLARVAAAFPAVSLVFVGRIMAAEQAAALAALPNVYLLGSRPPTLLGSYLATFTTGLIPFVKNDLTAGIYPLKINEYLALGLPVVSTHFADLSDFQEVCTIADDTDAFLTGIAQALLPQPDAEREYRRRFAEQNTWAARAAELDQALQESSTSANTASLEH